MTRAQKKDFGFVRHGCPSGLGPGIWLDALRGLFLTTRECWIPFRLAHCSVDGKKSTETQDAKAAARYGKNSVGSGCLEDSTSQMLTWVIHQRVPSQKSSRLSTERPSTGPVEDDECSEVLNR